MLRSLVALGFVVLSGAASAQVTTCPGGVGQDLDRDQIISLLSGRYAYGNQFDLKYYNILHAAGGAGAVTDYKRGPGHPVDPSTPVGSYSVPASQVAGRWVVTYTYGSRSYSYSISDKPNGQGLPQPGPYTFCQRAATGTPSNVGQALSLTISITPGAVQP